MLAKAIEEVFHPQEAGDLTSIITKDETTLRIVSNGTVASQYEKSTIETRMPMLKDAQVRRGSGLSSYPSCFSAEDAPLPLTAL